MIKGALVQGREEAAFGSRFRSPNVAEAVNLTEAGLV